MGHGAWGDGECGGKRFLPHPPTPDTPDTPLTHAQCPMPNAQCPMPFTIQLLP
ncbi:hypothetical protein H6G98_15695 [Nostoc sp. FACHB-857]|nr:hypothetical protein [Nostoc sp. FACHB-857]